MSLLPFLPGQRPGRSARGCRPGRSHVAGRWSERLPGNGFHQGWARGRVGPPGRGNRSPVDRAGRLPRCTGGTRQHCCTPPARPLKGVKTCPAIGHSERVKVPGVEGNLTRSRDPSGGGTGPRWLRFQPAQRTPRRTPLSSTRVDSPEVSQRGRLTPRHAASVNDSYPVAPVRIVRHIPRRCPVCRLFCWWWGWQQPHRGRAARPALPPRGSPLAALPVWPPDPCGRISDARPRNSWW